MSNALVPARFHNTCKGDRVGGWKWAGDDADDLGRQNYLQELA
jgi:hypothetical protein